MNSAIILFIDDMGEMLLETMLVRNPRWVDMMSLDLPGDSVAGPEPSVDKTDDDNKDVEFHHQDSDYLKSKMQSLKKEVRILRRTMDLVLNEGGHDELKEQYHQSLESQGEGNVELEQDAISEERRSNTP